jgi:hypothetical protein
MNMELKTISYGDVAIGEIVYLFFRKEEQPSRVCGITEKMSTGVLSERLRVVPASEIDRLLKLAEDGEKWQHSGVTTEVHLDSALKQLAEAKDALKVAQEWVYGDQIPADASSNLAQGLDKLRSELAEARANNESLEKQLAEAKAEAGRSKSNMLDAIQERERMREHVRKAKSEIEKLSKFKAYVHQRLDEAGIPKDPESPHKAQGCRIGGRLDIALRQPITPADTPGETWWGLWLIRCNRWAIMEDTSTPIFRTKASADRVCATTFGPAYESRVFSCTPSPDWQLVEKAILGMELGRFFQLLIQRNGDGRFFVRFGLANGASHTSPARAIIDAANIVGLLDPPPPPPAKAKTLLDAAEDFLAIHRTGSASVKHPFYVALESAIAAEREKQAKL